MARGVPAYAMRSNPTAMLSISRKTFRDLDEFIQDVEGMPMLAMRGVNAFVAFMAYAVKGHAQGMSMGPLGPGGGRSNPALAYRIPVQRITGRYFAGWQVRRLGNARWMVLNEDRAAFIIEMGIGGRHVARPILKYAAIKMLRMIQTTGMSEQFGAVLLPRRNPRGHFQSFQSRLRFMQMAGPSGNLP